MRRLRSTRSRLAKREGRAADQGAVEVLVTDDVGAVVELNCETDFVAKGDAFGRALAALTRLVVDEGDTDTGAKKIDSQLAGASAIRNAISRWYRGEELLGEEGEQASMKVVDNSGQSVVTMDPRNKGKNAPPSAPPSSTGNGAPRTSAVEVLRGVEETQRRSVAALKAMVELLIEKGVFSRDEYLARVKR